MFARITRYWALMAHQLPVIPGVAPFLAATFFFADP